MNEIANIFKNPAIDLDRLNKIEALPEPRSRYIIAITPRSGSTYLCDMLIKSKRLGMPQEALGRLSINNFLKNIPGRSADDYLRNTMRVKQTANNIAGTKASWFQFQNFTAAMHDRAYLAGFKYIYLTRRDLAAQAVSLYKATASSIFHTNARHYQDALSTLDALEYDYEKIKYWHDHIVAQEQGWQRYFHNNRIFPLHITYEDIEADILAVMQRMAVYVKVHPENILLPPSSPYKKLADDRSAEWTRRFAWEYSLTENHPSPSA